MNSITCQINLDGVQQTMTLRMFKKGDDYFVANPYADKPGQSALVQLDPKRIRKFPEIPDLIDYTGVLLEIWTQPEELT